MTAVPTLPAPRVIRVRKNEKQVEVEAAGSSRQAYDASRESFFQNTQRGGARATVRDPRQRPLNKDDVGGVYQVSINRIGVRVEPSCARVRRMTSCVILPDSDTDKQLVSTLKQSKDKMKAAC